jgi:riboflavin synthase
MFTGIIETVGFIKNIESQGSNTTFFIESPLSSELKTDQSVSHDGVCLTVESVSGTIHQVTAVDETLQKTNLSAWTIGKSVNLERCMQMNGRLDGHIVQGHVDATGICTSIEDKNGSWLFTFQFNEQFAPLIIEKGSIAINGTSLTVFNVTRNSFDVTIIPYTFENTSIKNVKSADKVNLEFDVIGKYIQRMTSLQSK